MKLLSVLKVLSVQCSRSCAAFKFNTFNKVHQQVLAQRISCSFKPLSCYYSDKNATFDEFFHSYGGLDSDKNIKNTPVNTSSRTLDYNEDFESDNSRPSRSKYQQNDRFQDRNRRNDDIDDDDYRSYNRHSSSNRRNFRNDEYDDDYRSYNQPRSSNRRNFRNDDFDDGDYGSYKQHRSPMGRNFQNDDFGGSYDHRSLGEKLQQKDWKSKQLQAVEKNFYVEHDTVSAVSEKFLSEFYTKKSITISKGELIKPVMDFHHANFPAPVIKHMENLTWSEPTSIQSIGWPLALSGKNMVGIAQTGSGKTLGFILPTLVHIKHQRRTMRGDGPVALVLAPTRELAQQIHAVAQEYGSLLGIRSAVVFGGQSKFVQERRLAQSPELVIATPGRLLDFLESEFINLERTTFTVLDEADRMLDMGFEPQIRKVLGQIRPDRQMLMWSATWPTEIQNLAHDFLGDFTQINIGSTELSANPDITQEVFVCGWREKFPILLKTLKGFEERTSKILIFTRTKSGADLVSNQLRRSGLQSNSLHGNKTQMMRDRILHNFKTGRTPILVATDVASRGLDVDDIKLVVNYDYPNNSDDYIHRIGRTGRASKAGHAVTLVTDADQDRMIDLIKVLKGSDQEIPDDLADMAQWALKKKKNKRGIMKRNNFNNYNRDRRPSWSRSGKYDDYDDRW